MQTQRTAQPVSSILIVDDTPENLELLLWMLKERGYNVRPVTDGSLALAAARKSAPDLILLDINMPEMNGYQVCQQLKADSGLRDIPVIFISALRDSFDKVRAFGEGGVDYITKPFQAEEVEARVKTHLALYHQQRVERALLEQTLNGSVKLLTDILASVDPQSFGRARRLRDLVMAYVKFADLGSSAWEYELAAMLSPIGLVTVPPAVLNRFRQGLGLSGKENAMMDRVPELGSKLLSNIPRLESVAQIILYQNKDFDGEGFPNDSVSREEIHLGARILKILGDFVKLEERNLSMTTAFARMQRDVGRYDPQLLKNIALCFTSEGLPQSVDTEDDQAHVMELKVSQLKAGDLLDEDVMSTNGTLVFPAQTVLSTMLLIKLHNFAALGGIVQPIKVRHRSETDIVKFPT